LWVIGGTEKFKNIKGDGRYKSTATAEEGITEWTGEIEYQSLKRPVGSVGADIGSGLRASSAYLGPLGAFQEARDTLSAGFNRKPQKSGVIALEIMERERSPHTD
jgi:hypothetical protein